MFQTRRFRRWLWLPFLATLAGCDTEQELARQKLEMLTQQAEGLRDLKAFMQSGAALQGPGVASVFVSAQTLNTILAAGDGALVPIPGVAGAVATIKKIRTSFGYGYPRVSVDATVTRPGLGATLTVSAVATIESRIDSTGSPQLKLRVRLESVVPDVHWGYFDLKIGGFIRDLAQVKLDEKLRTLGEISIPISTSIPLQVPAQQTDVAFPGARGTIATPGLSIMGIASVTKVVTLPDGLHVFGKVSM